MKGTRLGNVSWALGTSAVQSNPIQSSPIQPEGILARYKRVTRISCRTPTVARALSVASARPGIVELPSGVCLGKYQSWQRESMSPAFLREASVATGKQVFTGWRVGIDRCATTDGSMRL